MGKTLNLAHWLLVEIVWIVDGSSMIGGLLQEARNLPQANHQALAGHPPACAPLPATPPAGTGLLSLATHPAANYLPAPAYALESPTTPPLPAAPGATLDPPTWEKIPNQGSQKADFPKLHSISKCCLDGNLPKSSSHNPSQSGNWPWGRTKGYPASGLQPGCWPTLGMLLGQGSCWGQAAGALAQDSRCSCCDPHGGRFPGKGDLATVKALLLKLERDGGLGQANV
ncbi:hypothetical protein DSO57_1035626 [Entomophthora muscae]|uniref:Uncharacterized protein n=1 Tax=Entomophthora muscae TaxID=34485 RepID=A0ACC2TXM9_9FUNG|nr:hypothetical protein DSO57_1035626 [Entomophthora muscae]